MIYECIPVELLLGAEFIYYTYKLYSTLKNYAALRGLVILARGFSCPMPNENVISTLFLVTTLSHHNPLC